MDENKVTRFRSVLGGVSCRGFRSGDYSRFCWKDGRATPGFSLFNVWGGVPEVRSPSQKQSATCVSTQKIRWSGRAWDAQRGDSSRYIFRFRKIQCTKWRWVTAWIRFMRRGARRGRKNIAIGRRNSPLFTKAASTLPLARQPRLLRCNWRTTLALGTLDRLSSARSRPTLALSPCAYGTGSDESSPGPAITSQAC